MHRGRLPSPASWLCPVSSRFLRARCVHRHTAPSHLPAPRVALQVPRPVARQGTSALSDANKLLTRCAWAGISAFVSTYGSSWVSGACPPPPQPPSASESLATKASLETAVQMWVNDRAAALSAYGPISGWVVSSITNMSYLFNGFATFDEDLSNWNTSSVTDMSYMFQVRSPARV